MGFGLGLGSGCGLERLAVRQQQRAAQLRAERGAGRVGSLAPDGVGVEPG